MGRLSITIEEDLLARFDEVAAGAGGRRALLRQLMMKAAVQAAPGLEIFEAQARPVAILVRLGASEAAHLACEAEAMEMSRATWAAALIRRHFLRRPHFTRSGELCLFAIHGELRRIRAELTELTTSEGPSQFAACAEAIDGLRQEIAGHMAGLRAAIDGNLNYWRVTP